MNIKLQIGGKRQEVCLLSSVFCLLFSCFLFTRFALADTSKTILTHGEYQYQKAFYLYLTGDYLSSSIIGNDLLNSPFEEKDKVTLLLKLSDIKRLHSGSDYQFFTFKSLPKDMSEIIRLLDAIYQMDEYERLFLSRELDNRGAINYFEGMSLLHLNRLEDARQSLLQVTADDKFYPHARIALAQIEVMKQKLEDAKKILIELPLHPSVKGELSERVNIMFGQVLFEDELFLEAINEFLKVPNSSPFYRNALLGQAWSLIKLDSYDVAISILNSMKTIPPYDSIEQEAEIIKGYCYLKSGDIKKALEHFQILSKTFSADEKRLDWMIENKPIRERYISILSGKKPHRVTDLSTHSLSGESSDILPASVSREEEEYYLSILSDKNDKKIFNLIEEYGLFHNMLTSFIEKEKEIMERETYIENTIKGLENTTKEIESDIKRVNNLLSFINKMAEIRLTEEKHDEALFTHGRDVFYNHWNQIMKRHITDTEGKMVRLILLEVEEAMRCLKSPITCPIINTIDSTTTMEVFNRPEDLEKLLMTIEIIGKDIDNIQAGNKIKAEGSRSEIDTLLQKRIKSGYEAIKELEKIRGELQNIILDTDRGLDEAFIKLDNHIKDRFLATKYEMRSFKGRIDTALDMAAKETEKEKERMQNEKKK